MLGGTDTADAAEAAALFGVDPSEGAAILAAFGEAPDAGTLELSADCHDAVALFDAISTQWRTAGMAGVPTGLDFAALDVAARWLRIEPSPRLLADIGLMEAAGLALFAERRS